MKVKVANRAFSNNQYLVSQLRKSFADSVINDDDIRYEGQALIDFLFDAEAAVIGLEKVNEELLSQLPNLKIIVKYGVGLDNLDLKACERHNVKIGWTGGVNKRSVAEMALGFMLSLSRNLYLASNQLKDLNWYKNGGFQLTGKTIGVIGLGFIGKELIKLLKPFDCRILANDILDFSDYAKKHRIEMTFKGELYRNSDFITLHVPLTQQTENLINKEVFDQMKSSAYLINTARGGIVNENDLKNALISGKIAGAALDVYEIEPPTDITLLSIPNLINTPHTGGNAYEAVVAMGMSAIEHLKKISSQINQ